MQEFAVVAIEVGWTQEGDEGCGRHLGALVVFEEGIGDMGIGASCVGRYEYLVADVIYTESQRAV